ncbi:MAG: hypothetical protein QS721_09240 [Candidatus Endonucleobacter sp. (ex Gigantidas childressi)]|nr:hypothetical protein [Candidatus Endonucleobacter sp. (ex Gigantidas childressi)]
MTRHWLCRKVGGLLRLAVAYFIIWKFAVIAEKVLFASPVLFYTWSFGQLSPVLVVV